MQIHILLVHSLVCMYLLLCFYNSFYWLYLGMVKNTFLLDKVYTYLWCCILYLCILNSLGNSSLKAIACLLQRLLLTNPNTLILRWTLDLIFCLSLRVYLDWNYAKAKICIGKEGISCSLHSGYLFILLMGICPCHSWCAEQTFSGCTGHQPCPFCMGTGYVLSGIFCYGYSCRIVYQ